MRASSRRSSYPKEGGFGGFAEAFAKSLEGTTVELLRNAKDSEIEFEPGTHRINRVKAMGRTFEAPRYLWSGSWLGLMKALDIPWQNPATDRVVLGSFVFDGPLNSEFDELLVGDPSHVLNRVYLPARFRNADEPYLQIEFSFPVNEERPLEPEHWRDAWMGSLRRLGLVQDQAITEFDFKTFVMHFNAYGAEGQPLQDADPSVLVDSNIHAVVPSLANLNLNRYVPRVVRDVSALLAEI